MKQALTNASDDCRVLPLPPRGERGEAPRHDRHERGVVFDFSSGTTGAPKAVLFNARQMFGILRSVNAGFGWGPGLRLVTALPWPQKVGVRWTWRAHAVGGAVVCVPFPETRARLDRDIESFGVTALMSSPWQLRRLMASPPAPPSQRRLSFLCNAGAPITPVGVSSVKGR